MDWLQGKLITAIHAAKELPGSLLNGVLALKECLYSIGELRLQNVRTIPIRKYLFADDGKLRPQIIRAALCLSLLLMSYVAYSAWAGSGGQIETNLMCATAGCGYVDSRALQVGDEVPDICPKCDKRSVYQALKCVNCARPLLVNELKGLPGPTRCAHCGTEMPNVR